MTGRPHDDPELWERALLEARTQALARPAVPDEATDRLDVLVLRVAGERYAVATIAARAVVELRPVTPLPQAPPEVAGLMARGGTIVPVFRLRALLGLPAMDGAGPGRLLLLDEGARQLALLVDAVEGTERLATGTLREAPSTMDEPVRKLIRGMDPQGLLLLDHRALLDDPRLVIDTGPRAGTG